MALVLVLGVLLLLSFVFLFFSFHSRNIRFTTHRTLDEEMAFQSLRAAANIYWSYLAEVCRRREGCDKLFAPVSSPVLPGRTGGLDGLVLGTNDFAAREAVRTCIETLAAQCPDAGEFRLESRWRVTRADPEVTWGRVTLTASCNFRGQIFAFDFVRDFKLVQALPPVLAKFTLFMRECADPNQFNILSKSFQQDRGDKGVLTLRHTPRSFFSSDLQTWKSSGWVFLGGNEVLLNLDGSHPSLRQSENFIFWPGLFVSAMSPDLPYSCTPYLGASRMRVRFTPIGAMSDWVTSNKLCMVLGSRDAPRLEKASVLRLYGDRDRISPTRVIGNVKAGYALYATLIYDANDDTVPDTVTDAAGLQQRAIFPLPRLARPELYAPPYLPRMLTTRGFDLQLDGSQLPGAPSSLGDIMPAFNAGAANDYITFMTKFAADFTPASGLLWFNALYDQVFDRALIQGTKTFPAQRQLALDDYPNAGRDVEIPQDQERGGVAFRGDLTTFDPTRAYQSAEVFGWQFDSSADFNTDAPWQPGQPGVRLIDQPLVARIKGDLTLPPAIQVDAPVVLVADGNIRVDEVKPSATQAPLVLVSLTGDIIAGGGKINGALLVCPAGTLRWTRPLDLVGSLCVRHLDPAIVAQGGEICYQPAFDPSAAAAAPKGAALMLGPNLPQVIRR